jgi:hypothetical protein
MNRLAPLIVRRVGPKAPALQLETPAYSAEDVAGWIEDLKLFAVGWLGGLIFFGTYLG